MAMARSQALFRQTRSPLARGQGPGHRVRHPQQDAFRAVDDVSFTLHPGETLCLVGESGSGKSVLARSILQIVDPPGGIASGRDPVQPSADGARQRQGSRSRPRRVASPVEGNPRGARPGDRHDLPGADEFTVPGAPHRRSDRRSSAAARAHAAKAARARSIELLEQVGIPNPQNRHRPLSV